VAKPKAGDIFPALFRDIVPVFFREAISSHHHVIASGWKERPTRSNLLSTFEDCLGTPALTGGARVE
jgi:hypothetical protein